MTARCWTVLGLAATTDERAIKRAYAARLKAIDPEADAEGFIALRGALQQAQAMARAKATTSQEAATVHAPPDAAAADAEPAASEQQQQQPNPFTDIQRLVFGQEPREAIFAPLQALAAQVLAAPEMAALGHAAAVENWFGETILRGIPRTNALLAPSIERFGWIERAQRYDCPPAVHRILERYQDCVFAASIADRAAGQAYTILRAPPDTYRMTPQWAREVTALLSTIRTHYRTLERDLDPASVQAWEAYTRRYEASLVGRLHRSGRSVAGLPRGLLAHPWLALFVTCLLVPAVHNVIWPKPTIELPPEMAGRAPFLPAADRLTDERPETEKALREITDDRMGYSDAQANPRLARALSKLWRMDAAIGMSQFGFAREAQLLFWSDIGPALATAPAADIVKLKAIEADEATRLAKQRDWDDCAAFLSGAKSYVPSRAILEERRGILLDILVKNAGRATAPPPKKVGIAGDVIAAARKASGFWKDDFTSALKGKGSAETRCRGRTALIIELLKRPSAKAVAALRIL